MTQRKGLLAGLSALAFTLLFSVGAAPMPPSAPAYGCHVPASPPAAQAGESDFAVYSWQMFVALNWPELNGQRGVPNCRKPLGAAGATVWQSYRRVESIFLPDAKNPGSWNTPLSRPLLLQDSKASQAVLQSALGGVLQPVGGWLIDQRTHPTYYEIADNRISYDYIVKNDLYNGNVVNADRPIAFPDGTMEVKASWRILTPKDDRSRYLTMAATVATFDSQGRPKGKTSALLGLVGLHIIVKPTGFPQWIWSTFEQVDNLVAPPRGLASYLDPKAPAGAVNQSPCQPGVLPCTPKAGATFQTPDPLTRMTPVSRAVDLINKTVQAKFGATFVKYYELVGTQWPSDPSDPGNPLGTPTPNVLANVTMESYIQPTSSCMACHSTAVSGSNRYKSDFSFLFIHAKAPKGDH
jgi:hypothetical protein